MANQFPVREKRNKFPLLVTLLQAVLVIAKLTGGVHWPWLWVLLPSISYIAIVLGIILWLWLVINWEEQEMLNKKR